MSNFRVGDILVPNRICINDDGSIRGAEDWCDYRHKYQVMEITDTGARLKGITNGRGGFYLNKSFVERNYKLDDPECGPCKSMCKKGKRCELFEEK